ncbi:MAG TPA: DUF3455 domain-containing protein [Pseudolabrys sp.]|nr:DUF3455 domain-containing protein [Pseudolabrys sp.]
MHLQKIRRRADGLIDIDSFRQEALALRARTRTQFFRSAGRAFHPVILAIIAAYISMRLIAPVSVGAEVPDAIAARGETLVTTAHAVGVQVYECKFDSAGKPTWQFREPIATLIIDGKTVGRHFAGPVWEMSDGSAANAKVSAQAPGATPNDIPLLRLDVAARHGSGLLSGVTTIQRLNTHGGRAGAACDSPGALLGVPYTADYAFYRKASAAVQSH